MRAFRLDKMTLAALEATLRLYLHEERALQEMPVLRMLGTPLKELRRGPRRWQRSCVIFPASTFRCATPPPSLAAVRCRSGK